MEILTYIQLITLRMNFTNLFAKQKIFPEAFLKKEFLGTLFTPHIFTTYKGRYFYKIAEYSGRKVWPCVS